MTDVVTTSVPPDDAALWTSAQCTRLVRLCSGIVYDRAVAEDLAQETMLEAWRLRGRLSDPSGAEAWLNAIARNICRRWLRAQGRAGLRRGDLAAEPDTAVQADQLDAVLEREELVELLDRALSLLPAATRETLVAHYVEELSHAEIAQRIGASPDAVSMRISRGRRRLRFLLETRFADDVLAESWMGRNETGWRPTRLRCVDCGSSAMWLRQRNDEIAFRCRTCDPTGLAVRLPLDTPVFAGLVGGLRRPSAIQARTARWSLEYWSPTSNGGRVRCVRCDHVVPTQQYAREDRPTWSCRNGWYADCPSCGEQVSGSIGGLALAMPEVQAARRREPRLRALPVRDVVRDGQPAKIVGFAGPDGVEVASVVFLRDSFRLVHVWSVAGRAPVDDG